MQPREIASEFFKEHAVLCREVEAQITKGLRVGLITSVIWTTLRNVAFEEKNNLHLDIEAYRKTFEMLKLSRCDARMVIAFHWFFTRKLSALAVKEIYSEKIDIATWEERVKGVANTDFVKVPSKFEGQDLEDIVSLRRYADEFVLTALTTEGKDLLVSKAIKFVNGPNVEGFRITYADLDAGVLFGKFNYV